MTSALKLAGEKIESLCELIHDELKLSETDTEIVIQYHLLKNSSAKKEHARLNALLIYLNYFGKRCAGAQAMQIDNDKMLYVCEIILLTKRYFLDGHQNAETELDKVGSIALCRIVTPLDFHTTNKLVISTALPNRDSKEPAQLKDFCGIGGDCTLVERGLPIYPLSWDSLMNLMEEKLRLKIPKFDEAIKYAKAEIGTDIIKYLKLIEKEENGARNTDVKGYE